MQSLRRGLMVIKTLIAEQPCGLHELHEKTGLPKPTLLRILAALEEMSIVFRPIGDKRYRASANSFLTAQKRDMKVILQEAAVPVLSALCKDIVWPSDLVMPDGNSMIVVASNRMLSPFSIKPTAHGYQPDMLLTAVGRAYLAYSDVSEREKIIADIARTQLSHPLVGDASALETLLRETKKQGYGVRSNYKSDGFAAVAVPVFFHRKPIACLNLFFYASAISLDNVVSEHLQRLRLAAEEITSRLAFSGEGEGHATRAQNSKFDS